MEKEFKYCGEIIDHSWFDDPEAHEKGTYYPTTVSLTFNVAGINPEFLEWYISLNNSKKIYLDEYPEQEELRKQFFNIIEEIVECSLISEQSNPYEHFYRRFMRRN